MNDNKLTRRDFMGKTAVAAAVAGFPSIIPASALGKDGKPAPSNRITLAVIGTGNQGLNDLGDFLRDDRVQVVAVCDVNRESAGYWNGGVAGREPARRRVEEHYASQKASGAYKGCAAYEDFREVLARKDIDAVEIATPDHWHAIPVVMAARAKKDIYCQKPLSLTIAEGRAMSDAVKKNKVIFQTGSQQRSDRNFRRAAELVRNGRIGKLHTVRCGLPGGRPDFGKTGDRKQPEPVPEGFNYDLWLGPAPEAPYAPARTHVNFRWIYDYSGGQVTDWGGHHPDCAQWGMGTDYTGPVEIRNAKGVFPPDPLWNTATDYYFEAIYANGVKMIISNKEPRGGVTWEGSDGWVWADRGRHDASSKEILNSEIGPNEIHLYESNNHFRNFIDGVISRKEPVAPVEVAHRSITVCHLGNIAMRLGKSSLKWDPAKERIIGDAEASKMLSRPYRKPWRL
ncbi:MAG: Gfo/Idh/MocA family oxidoreductase [Armatimonadetes bacterium]|nr:Gfo/Idh/MocA family oxidoreductase [Armatimonadota bacterium]